MLINTILISSRHEVTRFNRWHGRAVAEDCVCHVCVHTHVARQLSGRRLGLPALTQHWLRARARVVYILITYEVLGLVAVDVASKPLQAVIQL